MKKSGFKGFLKKLHKYRVYLLMLAPAVIYTLLFAYYPMTGRSTITPEAFGAVPGTGWRTSGSFSCPARRGW